MKIVDTSGIDLWKRDLVRRVEDLERVRGDRGAEASSTESLISDVDKLTLELQSTIGNLKSKLDSFSAKVDSIDLSYDKRISTLEAILSSDSYTNSKLFEQLTQHVNDRISTLWSDTLE